MLNSQALGLLLCSRLSLVLSLLSLQAQPEVAGGLEQHVLQNGRLSSFSLQEEENQGHGEVSPPRMQVHLCPQLYKCVW